MMGTGILIVAAVLSTMIPDRRYASGFRGNVRLEGWRLFGLGIGIGLWAIGAFINHFWPEQPKPAVVRAETAVTAAMPVGSPAPIKPQRLQIAGIGLDVDQTTLERMGADCFEGDEEGEPGWTSCQMDATFGGMQGTLNVLMREGKAAGIFANDNAPEQFVGLRKELIAAHGQPARGDQKEQWTLAGEVITLDDDSVELYRPE